MKNILCITALLMLAALFAVTGFAQKQLSKDELLKQIATLSNSSNLEEKDKGYQLGKEFLSRFGTDKNDNIKKVRNFVESYRTSVFYSSVNRNKFADAFRLGKEILADQPQNLEVLINMTYAGYNAMASGEKSYLNDTIAAAKKAEELLDGGSTANSYAPFKDKPEATAWIYYIDGTIVSTTDKKAGAASIYKATLPASPIKDNSLPYILIAQYYEDAYAKLGNELKVKLAANPVNEAEANALTDRATKALELRLDACARSSKRADAENSENKDVLKNQLTALYKFVKKTDVGLAEYVSYINKTPLPDPSQF